MAKKAKQIARKGKPLRKQRDLSEPVRRCIASGRIVQKEELLRFVISPQGELVHDIQGKLPGRGIWIGSQRDDLELALKKGLFSRSAKQPVSVVENLANRVEAGLAKRCLDLLGLGRKGGTVNTGFAKVEASLRSGKALILLGASDGAEDGRRKLRRLAGSLPLVEQFSCDELSKALGRENVIHASMARSGLTDKFLVEVSKLAGFRNLDDKDERTESE